MLMKKMSSMYALRMPTREKDYGIAAQTECMRPSISGNEMEAGWKEARPTLHGPISNPERNPALLSSECELTAHSPISSTAQSALHKSENKSESRNANSNLSKSTNYVRMHIYVGLCCFQFGCGERTTQFNLIVSQNFPRRPNVTV